MATTAAQARAAMVQLFGAYNNISQKDVEVFIDYIFNGQQTAQTVTAATITATTSVQTDLLDNRTAAGTKIASGAGKKIAFYGNTPIVQPNVTAAAVTDIATAAAAINSIRNAIGDPPGGGLGLVHLV